MARITTLLSATTSTIRIWKSTRSSGTSSTLWMSAISATIIVLSCDAQVVMYKPVRTVRINMAKCRSFEASTTVVGYMASPLRSTMTGRSWPGVIRDNEVMWHVAPSLSSRGRHGNMSVSVGKVLRRHLGIAWHGGLDGSRQGAFSTYSNALAVLQKTRNGNVEKC